MKLSWFVLCELAILLASVMAGGMVGIDEIEPPQYMVGESWVWNGGEMVQTVIGEEPDHYVFDVQIDIQGHQQFWVMMNKENAGVERLWGTFIEPIDVVLDPPFTLFPLLEHREGTLIFYVYAPMRIDALLTFQSDLVGVEEITVPAGTFETYHMSQAYEVMYGTAFIDLWFSPEVRQYIKIDIRQMPFVGDLYYELTSCDLLM